MGDVRDFRNFMGAVIDEKAFKKISGYIDRCEEERDHHRRRRLPTAKKGYFIEPTVVEAKRPDYRLMCEEIFGPVLTTYVYHGQGLVATC